MGNLIDKLQFKSVPPQFEWRDGWLMWNKINEIIEYLNDLDSIKHGCWIKEYDELGIDRGWKCSLCQHSVYSMTYEPYKYCPHCGSKNKYCEIKVDKEK